MIRLTPSQKMTAHADEHKMPADHPMRLRATELAEAQKNYISPRAYMTVWKRAFDIWSKHTGQGFS
jgi:hypothetical protein